MDPFQVNPLIVLLSDIPVRLYLSFVGGVGQGLGLFIAYLIVKRKLDK